MASLTITSAGEMTDLDKEIERIEQGDALDEGNNRCYRFLDSMR